MSESARHWHPVHMVEPTTDNAHLQPGGRERDDPVLLGVS